MEEVEVLMHECQNCGYRFYLSTGEKFPECLLCHSSNIRDIYVIDEEEICRRMNPSKRED